MKNENPKLVFGIGLPKTGSTSLHCALPMLGFPTMKDHRAYSHWLQLEWNCDTVLKQPPFHRLVDEGLRGFVDGPIYSCWWILKNFYPNAYFIRTVRHDQEEWIKSWRRHEKNWRRATPVPRDLLLHIRDCHYKSFEVHAKPDRYLELNVCEGEGWEKLCPFLGVPIPDKPFPHANKSSDVAKAQAAKIKSQRRKERKRKRKRKR